MADTFRKQGHRFNAHKLLIDPYAKALVGEIKWSDAHFGYRIGHEQADLSFDLRDDAHAMPKCRVIDPTYNWGDDAPPRIPWQDTVIYEMHMKGFTMTHPGVPPELRGTYAGLGSPAAMEHLKRLGVTAVELMPVHAFADDRHLVERGLRNYWGYNSLAFLAPEPRYASTGHMSEFKTMVKTLHAAGIEVILDVVYNHTAEGNHLGPTLSLRGIDNATLLSARARRCPPLHGLHWLRQHAQHGEPARVWRSSWTACVTGCRRCTSTVFASIWPWRWPVGHTTWRCTARLSRRSRTTPCSRR